MSKNRAMSWENISATWEKDNRYGVRINSNAHCCSTNRIDEGYAVKEQIADFGIRSTMKILHSNPEKALPRLVNIADTFAHSTFPSQMDMIKEAIGNTDSNIYKMLVRVLKERDADEVDNLVTNFLMNAGVKGWNKQKELREKYNCNIPWAILLDPTSACNLHCKGCWAADYGNRLNLSYDDIDDIIRQGEELGTYMYIYTGGEPLVRKDDLIKLCEAHPECTFLCFTNGTLIDQKFCDDLKRVKNFVPALSVEGNKETTDFRRGAGVYDRCVRAMNLMKENGLIFGISCCYTSENYDVVSSSAYLDQMIDWGAVFVWYFHYMPVGSDANIELMCTPEQREEMYHRIRHYRETKSIFPMDFQNDGQSVQGCIAGGRRYFHINANRGRRRSLRVYPLQRFEHPRQDPARVPSEPAVPGLPRQPALQREHAASLPHVGKP